MARFSHIESRRVKVLFAVGSTVSEELRCLAHERHYRRLRDRLTETDRHSVIDGGELFYVRYNKFMTRRTRHGIKHAQLATTAAAQLHSRQPPPRLARTAGVA